ncbi:ketosteroid isomerase-like protein [Nakamurella sp. UYEF19]|uniref:nuclear transport factor 2 family protein n=1 Tax=Nakamurella sp. UYEF19 TaxID=1756392 RepID=UPI003391E788
MTSQTITTAQAVEVCDRMFTSIDTRDWDQFERCFADDVVTDFTGLWGGKPEHATAHHLRDGWERLFAGFTATQHLVANYVADHAHTGTLVSAAFRATHFGVDPFGSASWTLYGRYRITLVHRDNGFVIQRLEQTPTAADGNRNIVLLALAAATASVAPAAVPGLERPAFSLLRST